MKRKFQSGLNRLLNEFCNKDFIVADLQETYHLNLLANQISCGYGVLEQAGFEKLSGTKVELSCIGCSSGQCSDREYLEPLNEINGVVRAKLAKHIQGFYYHGSMSSMDYAKGWSDVDTFVVINNGSVTSAQALLEIRKCIHDINEIKKKIDPLQHHGVSVFCEYDLFSFFDTFTPLNAVGPISAVDGSVTSFSYNLIGTGFSKKDSLARLLNFIVQTHRKGVFEHHPYANEHLLSSYRNSHNGMYQMKYYLGLFLLIPSMYLGVLGKDTYKKEALSRVDDLLSRDSAAWIHRISELRMRWHDETKGTYAPNRIPHFVRQYIPENYFELGSKFALDVLNRIEKNKDRVAF